MTKPHVLYRYFDADDNLLYVGITNSPLSRMSQHFRDKGWFAKAARTTYEHFASRPELEAAEVKAIQSEKPKYNIAHSVAPTPKRMVLKPQAKYANSRDANYFQAPDAIASEDGADAEREARLAELQQMFDRRATYMMHEYCPSCDLLTLFREYDDLVKCGNCLGMWLPEEIPSNFERLKQGLKKRSEESA
jgi:predicted GIY-YIG superfamily endonuclease